MADWPSNGGPPWDEQEEDDPDDREDYSDLEGKSVEEILREGQKVLFANLVGRVRDGKATHQEKAILRNLLKDNGLTLGIPPEGPPQGDPSGGQPTELPEFQPPEYLTD